jgi:hypothetical protein
MPIPLRVDRNYVNSQQVSQCGANGLLPGFGERGNHGRFVEHYEGILGPRPASGLSPTVMWRDLLCPTSHRIYRYEGDVLELVMRYLDVAQAQLLLDEMDGVPGIHDARRALINAQNAVSGSLQTQLEHFSLPVYTA